MVKERDFSNLRRFPGETGNLFDVILHGLEKIERIPWPVFGILLLGLAGLVSWFNVSIWAILWGFFLSDWLLIALLPKGAVSYGPPKPPTLLLAVLRSIFIILPLPAFLILQIIGTLLVIESFWIEPCRLTITHQKLESSKFHSARPLRILHLGDLHIERKSIREKKLTEAILSLKPELILFSGDILNLSYLHDQQAWQVARSVISEWQAPLGVYVVSGSPAVDLPEIMPDLIKGLPVRWLQNDKVPLEFEGASFNLIGLSCTHRPQLDGPKLAELLQGKDDCFTILLYHSPDLAPVAARLGIDLQLSGHTHNGQMWPFNYITRKVYELDWGYLKKGNTHYYVSCGVGTWGPPVRIGNTPEIVNIRLRFE